ncbi:Alpha/Beta hydrolase protein [Russula dissimulans]|nr:Alpha/Beta hydrolase protein [Russula dissimulans]
MRPSHFSQKKGHVTSIAPLLRETMADPDDSRKDTIPRLSPWQKLQILPVILILPFAVAIGVFRENKGRSWRRAARIATTRYIMGARAWTSQELKSFYRLTTAQVYAEWARKSGVEALTDELPEGARLHWIGPRREDRVVLYFHGGGYVFPASMDHLNMLGSLQKEYKGSVGIAMLNYSLVPESHFPAQLRQAVAAVQYLIDKGVSPSNIVIAGDSAGGNLALQLASQILHPLSSLPTLRPPRAAAGSSESLQPFGGLSLISPGVELGTDAPSYVRNDGRDVIPTSAYRLLRDMTQPGVTPALRHHIEPGRTPQGWWADLERVFPRVLITAGEHEALVDQIRAAAATIAECVQDTTVFVLPGGLHEDFIIAFSASEDDRRGDDYKLLVSWVSEALKL